MNITTEFEQSCCRRLADAARRTRDDCSRPSEIGVDGFPVMKAFTGSEANVGEASDDGALEQGVERVGEVRAKHDFLSGSWTVCGLPIFDDAKPRQGSSGV